LIQYRDEGQSSIEGTLVIETDQNAAEIVLHLNKQA
jgi:hypothetical protein